MAAYSGSGAKLQIGKELTYATAVAGAKDVNMTSESLKLNPVKQQEETLVASKSGAPRLLMSLDAGGDFSGILKPEFAGYLLYLALGGTDTKTDNSPVIGAYSHSIVAASAGAAFPSFTAIVDRRLSVRKYSGCKIDSFRLEGAAGDYVKYTATIKAKDESAGSLASITNALKSFKTINATITLGGTTVDAKKVTLTIANKQEEVGQTYTTGLYKEEPLHGIRDITVSVELNHSAIVDTIAAANLITDTPLATVVWTLYSPSMVTGTTPYAVTITLKNVDVSECLANISGTGIIPASITGTAATVSTDEPITCVVVDATTTAYSA